MFTGIVEGVAKVTAARGHAPRRITLAMPFVTTPIPLGASIAIDGCCLTVVHKEPGDALTFEAADETLKQTTIGNLEVGDQVNVEQAMLLGARLDGHLVLGHVDGVARVTRREAKDSAVYFGFSCPEGLEPLVAPRGSVTLAGVSLTVTQADNATFEVAIIPHTMGVTSIGRWQVGDPVNVEADCIARYVLRLMSKGALPKAVVSP